VNKIPAGRFAEFLSFFPLLTPPFSLLPDLQQIPSDPIPLPGLLLDEFILPFEGDETDDFTEYIPFGQIAGPRDFQAIIYWKAGVLRYEFILATYTAEGKPLYHAIVGGIRYEDEGTIHSVAVIHEDLRITIAEGMSEQDDQVVSPETQTYQMAIRPSGEIMYEMNEEKK
jgi:hypothetical protein